MYRMPSWILAFSISAFHSHASTGSMILSKCATQGSKTFRDRRVSERCTCGGLPLVQVVIKEEVGMVDDKAARTLVQIHRLQPARSSRVTSHLPTTTNH